jgi:excisionase family DNA binding protein
VATSEERLLSLEDVADRLQVSDQTVRRWIKSGKLTAYKPGLEYRIREADLEEFLRAREVRPKAPSRSPLEPTFNDVLAEERRSPIVAEAVSDVAEKWHEAASHPDASLHEISTAVDAALALGEALIERFGPPSAAGYSDEEWEVVHLAARLLEISKAGNERILGRGEEERYRARKEHIRKMTRRISAA